MGKKFLKLYSSLSKEGVICKSPTPYRFIGGEDQLLKQIIVDSLRELRRFDMYFMSSEVRIIGGFERADLFILNDKSRLNTINSEIRNCGLYILD